MRYELSSARAGARAEIEDVVGRADRFFVVLDDDHRVPKIAQAEERLQEARIVPLVEADTWFIEHVKHARQAGADLRREADALRFAAGERAAFPVEREIAEPDLEQESEARFDFAPHVGHDGLLLWGESEAADELRGLLDREFGEFVDVKFVLGPPPPS